MRISDVSSDVCSADLIPALPIDRDVLRGLGFILPDSPVSSVSEEFRIIKRQLLLGATGKHGEKLSRGERILVCSAHPGEGKTFCAINLALSMAAEKDVHVLHVDADFAKPSIMSRFGFSAVEGLTVASTGPSRSERCRAGRGGTRT